MQQSTQATPTLPAIADRLSRAGRFAFYLITFASLFILGVMLLLAVYYNGDSLQITAELAAESEVIAYDLAANRPVEFALPPGRYVWSSASLAASADSNRAQLSEPQNLTVRVTSECPDCAASSVRVRQYMTREGLLHIVWDVSQSGPTPAEFRFASHPDVVITEPIQVGYESLEPIERFRTTHFGTRLTIGSQIGAEQVDYATTKDAPILRSGDVGFFGRALLGDHRYEISRQQFLEGDIVRLEQGYGDGTPEVWMQINYHADTPTPVFHIVARAATDEASLTQNQAAEAFVAGVGWADQFVKEPLMLVLYGSLMFLSVLMGVFIKSKEEGDSNDRYQEMNV